jgi:hypothetical protein
MHIHILALKNTSASVLLGAFGFLCALCAFFFAPFAVKVFVIYLRKPQRNQTETVPPTSNPDLLDAKKPGHPLEKVAWVGEVLRGGGKT